MADVEVRDILLRCGGRTLHRTGFLAAMGAGRGYVEAKETFTRADASTCATFIDRDVGAGQILRLAEAGKVRIEYPPALSGLVDAFGYPYCGPSLEGSRTNSCLRSQSLNTAPWTPGAATVTENIAGAPDGTATFSNIVPDATNTSGHRDNQAVTITANENLALEGFFLASGYVGLNFRVSDNPGTNSFGIVVDLSSGTFQTAVGGGGTIISSKVVAFGGGLYWVRVSGTVGGGVTAAGIYANVFDTYAHAQSFTAFAGDTVSGIKAWGIQLERAAALPSSYIKTVAGAVIRAADSLTLPFNFGPMDVTVLARVARPVWADAVGAIGLAPGIMDLGDNGAAMLRMYALSGTRFWVSDITTSASSVNSAIPAGAEQRVCAQYKNLKTAGLTQNDAGAGFTGFTGTSAAAFATFGNQTVRIGAVTGGANPLFSVLLDLIFARGLRTLNEMLAIP